MVFREVGGALPGEGIVDQEELRIAALGGALGQIGKITPPELRLQARERLGRTFNRLGFDGRGRRFR